MAGRHDSRGMHPICWTDRSPVRKPGFRYGQHACTVRIRLDSRLSWLVAVTWLNRPSASANQNRPATLSASTSCARRRMRPRMNSTEGSSLRAVGRHPHAMAWGCLATVIVHAPRRSWLASDDATIHINERPAGMDLKRGAAAGTVGKAHRPRRARQVQPYRTIYRCRVHDPGVSGQRAATASDLAARRGRNASAHTASGPGPRRPGRCPDRGRRPGIGHRHRPAAEPSRAAPRRAGMRGDADVAATRRASGAPNSSPLVAPR